MPRKTYIISDDTISTVEDEPAVESYPCSAFLSMEGYFKKCTPASLRGNDVQKFKENDSLRISFETDNSDHILFFTTNAQVYKARLNDFDDNKASALGDFIPAKLRFDSDERGVSALVTSDYKGRVLIFFENGKAVSLPLDAYATKTNRKKLTKAFYGDSCAVAVFVLKDKTEYLIKSDDDRALLIKGKQIVEKTTRTSSGGTVFTLKKGRKIVSVEEYDPTVRILLKESRYRKSKLPASGVIFEDVDPEITQQTLID